MQYRLLAVCLTTIGLGVVGGCDNRQAALSHDAGSGLSTPSHGPDASINAPASSGGGSTFRDGDALLPFDASRQDATDDDVVGMNAFPDADLPDAGAGCAGQLSFEDPELERAIRVATGLGSLDPIMVDDVATLTSLRAPGSADCGDGDGPDPCAGFYFVVSLSGIECLTGLVELDIHGSWVDDLHPLQGLPNLQTINLGWKEIDQEDIELLHELPALTGLNLDFTYQEESPDYWLDLSTVTDMTHLIRLSFASNSVRDISPLANLTALTELNLQTNDISDISVLENLTNLRELNLGWNGNPDLSPLRELSNLSSLDISRNCETDFSVIAELSSLTRLALDQCTLGDLDFLAMSTGLTALSLHNDGISDIDILSDLSGLEELSLGYNEIDNIQPLDQLLQLRNLDLWNNSVANISVLKDLTMLSSIALAGNDVSDIGPLVNNTGLGDGDYLVITGNPIDCGTQGTNIAQLRSRQVAVQTDCP